MNLGWICEDRPEVALKVLLDGDRFRKRFAEDRNDVPQQVTDIHNNRLPADSMDKIEDLAHKAGAPFGAVLKRVQHVSVALNGGVDAQERHGHRDR